MKNKIEITRKQLEVFGDLLSESEYLISRMIVNGQAGPSKEDAKNNKGLCKKFEGHYWWNDTLALYKIGNKASSAWANLYERMNQNDA